MMARTKDYNQRQRKLIESVRQKIAAHGGAYEVVDTKRTPHTAVLYAEGGVERFEPRTPRQVQLYGFYVVHK